jgi:hypothetical protein
VRGNILIDNETFLVTDFVNLKIKSTQSFKVIYRVRMYTRILIEMSRLSHCVSQENKCITLSKYIMG